jgi:putative endonuclease
MPSGFVYILASRRNGTLYTGITGDLVGRIRTHREGRGSAFVKKYNVTRLVWYEEHPLYINAIQRETNIKRWKRAWKLALIEEHNPDWNDLYDTLWDALSYSTR